MATEKGTSQRNRYRPLRYLFLNGDLHKVLFINRPKDEIKLWNYPKELRVVATYSDVKKRMGKAFTTTEVCAMLMRHKVTVERAILKGELARPQHTYALETGKIFKYMWSEKDIMDAHEYYSNKPWSGKRAGDGSVTPKNLPTARELRAIIRHDTILYAKTDDGYIPTWEAEQF